MDSSLNRHDAAVALVRDHATRRFDAATLLDAAHGLQLLRSRHSVPEIAALTGLRVSAIYDRLALLSLDAADQQAVSTGQMSLTDAVQRARDPHRATPGDSTTGAPQRSPGRGRAACAFGPQHRLAPYVTAQCTHQSTGRVLFSGTGCAECWEHIIRLDACGEPLPSLSSHDRDGADQVDEILLRRFLARPDDFDWRTDLAEPERRMVLREYGCRGANNSWIAATLGVSRRSVERWRAEGRLDSDVCPAIPSDSVPTRPATG